MSSRIVHARHAPRLRAGSTLRIAVREVIAAWAPVKQMAAMVAIAAVAAVAATAACASGGARRGVVAGGRTDVIHRNEIAKSTAQNAYDAVRLLRPSFLSGRGPTTLLRPRASSVAPVVYLDNQRLGDARTLENIPVEGIVEIRFVGASQAQLRWGMDHPAGAIQVVTGTVRSP